MRYRALGRTGMDVSEISFGAWAIGGAWGSVDDGESMRALHAAVDAGINFVDTADVYGDGRSERLVAQLRRERPGETIYVTTKAGRRLPQQTPEGYSRANLNAWVERSLRNLESEAVDLLQLHCPHPDVYARDEVFAILDELVQAGKIKHYGASVETVSEALQAIRNPRVETIQIIFNMFRHKPAELFFPAARAARVGVLARVPLASGLLTGKLNAASTFEADDHRGFNRNGEAFDRGETFSGVPFEVGLAAVEQLRDLTPPGATLAQFALRWTLAFPEVSCAIPGARNPQQARDNAAASALPEPDADAMAKVRAIYDERVRPLVHAHW